MKSLLLFIWILFSYHKAFSQDNIKAFQKILGCLQTDTIFSKFYPKHYPKKTTFDILLQPYAYSNPFLDFYTQICAKETNISVDSARKIILDIKNIQWFRKKFENYFGKWFNYQVLMFLKESRNSKSKFLLEFSNPCENYISCSIFLKKKRKTAENILVGTYLFYYSENHFMVIYFLSTP